MDALSNPGGRQRAQKACTYCRKRKMKCNNEKPRCSNCAVYDQTCEYVESSRKKRLKESSTPSSSDDRLARLEEENRSLRRRLASANSPLASQFMSQDASQHGNNDHSSSPFSSSASSSVPSPRSSREEWQPGLTRRGRYSRPESGFTGLATPSVPERMPQHDNLRFPTDHLDDAEVLGAQLEAEAADQRRQEALNYYSGTFDFDGVEPDLAIHLLTCYWHPSHDPYLITYRPAFMRDMACQGPYFSKLLLNAIYFAASRVTSRLEVRSKRDDARTAGSAFRQRVKELLVPEIERSRITTIQALLLMTRSLFALGEEKSVAWMYAGMAFRMTIDLGMHVDGAPSANIKHFSAEDLEIRRRVFWAAFVVDKIQSLYQGRPVEIQWVDCEVPLAFLDQHEEREMWQPLEFSGSPQYPRTQAYSISVFVNICKLCIIMNEIFNKFYAQRSQQRRLDSLVEHITPLHLKLEQWYGSLEPYLKFDSQKPAQVIHPPAVLSLLTMYNVLLIQLHHPFIAISYSAPPSDPGVQDSLVAYANAADEILLLLTNYDRAYPRGKAPYLIVYAIYVSATAHARLAASKPLNTDISGKIRICLDLLTLNQEINPGVRNAKASIKYLMGSLGVASPQNQSPAMSRPSSAQLSVPSYSTPESQTNYQTAFHSPVDVLSSAHTVPFERQGDWTPMNSSFESENFMKIIDDNRLSSSLSPDSLGHGVAASPYRSRSRLGSDLDILSTDSFDMSIGPINARPGRGKTLSDKSTELYGGYGGSLSHRGPGRHGE